LGSKAFRYASHRAFFERLLEVMRRRPDWEFLLVDGSAAGVQARALGLPNVRVVPWAPQLAVLRRARVMLTHGGINSVKECIWSGVPMLVLPLADDQPGNGARVAYHGLGACEDPRTLSARRLLQRLEMLLEAPAFRERVGALGHVFREYQASGRDAALVESFLAAPASWPGSAQPPARSR
jgi:UDP:flavonoid glycosyltransferase YjiC (YdhE family)